MAWPGAELIMYDIGQKRSYLNIHKIVDAFSFPIYICGQYQDENNALYGTMGNGILSTPTLNFWFAYPFRTGTGYLDVHRVRISSV